MTGERARTTTVDGADLDRVFDVPGSATVEISDLTITNGTVPGGNSGGGVRTSGGGLTLRRVAVDANRATRNGGGVSASGGTLTVVQTTVSGNSAVTTGGIRQDGGTASIVNSTISGNEATLNGGVTADASTVNIESSTIASNTSSSAGGGLLTSGLGSVINVKNSIVSANATTNCDTAAFPGGVILSQGNNIESGNSCGFGQLTDKPNTDPRLGPLQDNEGPTDTRAVLFGSPAIDAGDSAQTVDQRGIPRPLDGDGNGTGVDDIEGSSGTTNATFTVRRTRGDGPASVNFRTADGTATAPADYTRTSGTLNFAAGDNVETVTVPVRPDTIDERNETFTLNLRAPSPGTSIADGLGLGTIVDDDPGFSVSNASVTQGDSGTRTATFTVRRTGDRGRASVNFVTADDTAREPFDYTRTSGTLNFAAGETIKSVTVPVRGDVRDEPNETFFLELSGPRGAGLSDARGRGTIVDDDPTPGVSVDDVSLREGATGERRKARFTVSLSSKSSRSVTVDFATVDNTARAPEDYTPRSGSVTFAPGQTTQLVKVATQGDALREADESFFLRLSSPRNAVFEDRRGTGTIRNDD